MQKSLITCALMLSFSAVGQAHAIDCSQLEQWQPENIYNSGTSVQNNNIAYQSNWWNIADDPASNSGPWQAWRELGNCDTDPGNRPPKVTLTSPLHNAQFTDNSLITLSASASDNDGNIDSIDFLLGDVLLETLTEEPYTLKWNAQAGNHTIIAQVTDDQGKTSTDSVTISVVGANGNQAPTVSLANPKSDSQLKAGENVLISAKASDPDGAITKVDFFLDDKLLGSDSDAPFELSWNAEKGARKFMVKATDDEDISTVSEAISIAVAGQTAGGGCVSVPAYKAGNIYQAGDIVQNYNSKYRCNIAGWCSSKAAWAYEPGQGQHWTDAWSDLGVCAIVPEVKITAPAANSLILTGSDVKIEASATDSDGSITQVQFFAGNSALGTDTTAPFSANWLANGTGDIALKAIATDNEGNTGEASVLVIKR